MQTPPSYKDKAVYVFPTISRWAGILSSFLKKGGVSVYYRNGIYPQLVSPRPSDVWHESLRACGQFLRAAVRREKVGRTAKIFSLNPEVLLSMGREIVFKKMENDFYFAYLIAHGFLKPKTRIIWGVSRRWRQKLNEIFQSERENSLTRLFCTIGFVIERVKSACVILLKIGYTFLLFLCWKFTKPHPTIQEIYGNFLWLPGGPSEISLDPQKLSLPLYLKELLETQNLGNRKFAVICSFLPKDRFWADAFSFAIPHLRKIPPGLSYPSFFKGMRDLWKLFFCLPGACLRSSEEMELLSFLPSLFIYRAWLQNVQPAAVFTTESCAGAAAPLVHASREEGIPLFVIFYSANVRSVILKKENLDAIQPNFEYILADHLCVWTEAMKKWFIQAGYPPSKIHVVGPQMFSPYLLFNGKHRTPHAKRVIKIGLFDYFPTREDLMPKFGLGEYIVNTSYYIHFRKMTYKAVREVFGDQFKILFKMKRKAPDQNIDGNINHKEILGEFFDMEQYIEVKDSDANPWLVLSEADIIVAMPFTSPAQAGLSMGKPSVYFDYSGLFLRPPDDDVPLLSSYEEFCKWLRQRKAMFEEGALPQPKSLATNLGASRMAVLVKEILSVQQGKSFL